MESKAPESPPSPKELASRRRATKVSTEDLRRLSYIAGLDDDEAAAPTAAGLALALQEEEASSLGSGAAAAAAAAALPALSAHSAQVAPQDKSGYRDLLAKAALEDFSDLQKLNFMYTSGKDVEGRTIIVFVACNMPVHDLDRTLLYILRTMDKVVESPYIIVYIHAHMSSASRPAFSWLRKVYGIFNRKYKKNMKQLYVVRPTTWLKMVFSLFRPFVSQKFWRKLVYVEALTGIWQHLSPQVLHLPASVVRMDTQMQAMFGESLENVLTNPSNRGCKIPIVISDCIAYCMDKALDVEGLMRVTGDRGAISELRMAYDAGQLVDLSNVLDPHSIAGLFKMYLREMPTPLLTYDLFDALIHTMMSQMSEEEKCAGIKQVLTMLPEPNKVLLWHIILFALELSRHSAKNKMTVDNLAVCLGPTLIWRRPEDLDPATALSEMGYVNMLLRMLILHYNTALPPLSNPAPSPRQARHTPPARAAPHPPSPGRKTWTVDVMPVGRTVPPSPLEDFMDDMPPPPSGPAPMPLPSAPNGPPPVPSQ